MSAALPEMGSVEPGVRVLLLEGVHPDAAAMLSKAGYQVEASDRALDAGELAARIGDVQLLGIRSTTLRVFENGALNTAMPRRVAAARSIWFVPMQNAPTASSCPAAARTASVTCVVERMPSSCTSPMRAASSPASSARSDASTW